MGSKSAAKTVKIASKMDPALYRRLRIEAAKTGQTLVDLLDAAVRAYLKTGGKDKPQNGQQVS